MKTKYEAFKPARETVWNEYNHIVNAATKAEDEVLSARWKASDTLNRLLIEVRRSQDRVIAAIRACEKEADKLPEVATPNNLTDKMQDRFDKREEIENRDPMEKGNWNKF